MAISTTPWPAWAEAVTATDLQLLGMPAGDPADVLGGFVADDGVNLDEVTRCLDLLRSTSVVLHCGLPRALMAYSPQRKRFIASFDGELGDDLDQLTEQQAGLWLAMVAAENPLPDTADHWCCIKVDGRRLEGIDRDAIDTYLRHAHVLDTPHEQDDDYDGLMARAFWTCATRCLEGR
jgi:hypothetical protein